MGSLETAPRLTSLSHGAGCACKLSPAGPAHGARRSSVAPSDPDLLVGLDTVRRRRRLPARATTSRSSSPPTSSRRSSTTPTTGAASPRRTRSPTSTRWAARRCSRSTSSRGPREGLPFDLLARVLDGGGDVDRAARARSSAAATRSTTPSRSTASRSSARSTRTRVLTNAGAQAGDALVLTKPIGLGRRSRPRSSATPRRPALVAGAVAVMTTLNAGAARRGAPRRRGARRDRRHRLRPARPPARAVPRRAALAGESTRRPCR